MFEHFGLRVFFAMVHIELELLPVQQFALQQGRRLRIAVDP